MADLGLGPPPDPGSPRFIDWLTLLYKKLSGTFNADTVTTNANLTGPITSVGNATAVASQTGTGTKFVMDTSPTLVTPVIGVATGTSLAASGTVSGATLTASGTVSGATVSGTTITASGTVSGATVTASGTASGASVTSTGVIASSSASAGVGYATGAGGSTTQATSKTNSVVLNKICGQITTNNAALAAGAKATFVVTNSAMAATDVVVLSVATSGTSEAYRATVANTSAGNFRITLENITAGSLSESVTISFAIIKAVNA